MGIVGRVDGLDTRYPLAVMGHVTGEVQVAEVTKTK